MKSSHGFRTLRGRIRVGSRIEPSIQCISEFNHAVESPHLSPIRRARRQAVPRSDQCLSHGEDGVSVASDPDDAVNRVIEIGADQEAVERGQYRIAVRNQVAKMLPGLLVVTLFEAELEALQLHSEPFRFDPLVEILHQPARSETIA